LNREDAIKLLKSYVKTENLLKHMFATEAIMKAIASHLGENEEQWGLAGLLHDIDYEITANDEGKHGIVAQDILKGKVDETILRAIKSHGFKNEADKPHEKIGIALVAADHVSGLLVASARVMPRKKLGELDVSSLRRKFNDSNFARGSLRERIMMCEELEIPRDKFFEIALRAVQSIAEVLGF